MQRGFFQRWYLFESKGLLQLKGDDLIQRKVVRIIRHPDGLLCLVYCVGLEVAFPKNHVTHGSVVVIFSVLRALAR